MEYKLEKPFTDAHEKYTVLNSNEKECFELHNLASGKTYIINPFKGICDCPDFEFRSEGGTCKHIDYLKNNTRIKPLIKQYEKKHKTSDVKLTFQKSNQATNGNKNKVEPEIIEQMPYTLMERKDENQILAEIKGNVLDEFVYSFPQGNRTITGLSYSGVKQIALQMGNIHCEEPILQENGNCWICKVKAIDVQRNFEMWGVSQQAKFMELRSGQKLRDDFCIQKCVSKAERNALRKLMPEKIIIEMIKEWQSKKNGRGNEK